MPQNQGKANEKEGFFQLNIFQVKTVKNFFYQISKIYKINTNSFYMLRTAF